jgi:hypothetical protein
MARKTTAVVNVLNEVALCDQVWAAAQTLQDQLRMSKQAVLPPVLEQALPVGANEGDRVKVMQWRSFIVWADWTDEGWVIAVDQDGKPRS